MHMLSSDTTVDMIYLHFSKAFDKADHGVLLHKLKDLGITGKLGIWFFQFLTNRTHYDVRIPGGISSNVHEFVDFMHIYIWVAYLIDLTETFPKLSLYCSYDAY